MQIGFINKESLLQHDVLIPNSIIDKINSVSYQILMFDEKKAYRTFNILEDYSGYVLGVTDMYTIFGLNDIENQFDRAKALQAILRPFLTRRHMLEIEIVRRTNDPEKRQSNEYFIPGNLKGNVPVMLYLPLLSQLDITYSELSIPAGSTHSRDLDITDLNPALRRIIKAYSSVYMKKPIITYVKQVLDNMQLENVSAEHRYRSELDQLHNLLNRSVLYRLHNLLKGKGLIISSEVKSRIRLVKLMPELFELDLDQEDLIGQLYPIVPDNHHEACSNLRCTTVYLEDDHIKNPENMKRILEMLKRNPGSTLSHIGGEWVIHNP